MRGRLLLLITITVLLVGQAAPQLLMPNQPRGRKPRYTYNNRPELITWQI